MENNCDKLWNYLPLSFSMETVGGISTPIVLRGTPLPVSRKQIFSTVEDNQVSVKIKVYFGESPLSKKNKLISSFEIKGLPKEKRGIPRIEITFDINRELDTKICAGETITNNSSSITIKNSDLGITKKIIQELLTKAEQDKDEDNRELNKIETLNNATNTIVKAENFINEYQGDSSKRQKVEKNIAELGLVFDSENLELIREKTKILNESITISDFFGTSSIFDDFFKNYNPPKQKAKSSQTDANISMEKNKKEFGKIFGEGNFTLDPNLCFVLMPFSEKLKPIYEDHIVSLTKSKNLTPQRADEIYSTKLITWDIWEKLNRARIIIADLTDKNPNVFYELGLAHAISKDVIIISQNIEDVPFDLKALRCIIYEYNPRGVKKLEERLSSTIDELLKQNNA